MKKEREKRETKRETRQTLTFQRRNLSFLLLMSFICLRKFYLGFFPPFILPKKVDRALKSYFDSGPFFILTD
jgi:hypothetical protein